jgi:hypothetical protein
MNEEQQVTVAGLEVSLPDDRTVFVGHAEGDTSFYFRFRNGDAETRFRLSLEAVNALKDLLGVKPEAGEERTYQLVIDTALWQVAEPAKADPE